MPKTPRPIVFFDTEFTHLDHKKGELLSIGLIDEQGRDLYLELEHGPPDTMHPWVVEHVLPYLTGETITRDTACEKIRSFMSEVGESPYLMAYVNQFDAIYWYELFGDPKDHPAFWIPLDFASILFAHGFHPESMRDATFFTRIGIDEKVYQKHNALDDARLLRDVYTKFQQYISLAE